jgi:hypothetical protein
MGQLLPDEAEHAATGKTEEVGMISRTACDIQLVRAETPGAVDPLNGVHQS